MHNEKKGELAQEYLNESYEAFYANQLERASVLVQQALLLAKEEKQTQLHCKCLNLLGVIHAATGNEAMAIDYYLEGLAEALDNHCDNLLTLFYNNIGSRYQELNEYEKALLYFDKAAKALEYEDCKKEERYDIWCLITYLNLIICYKENRQFAEAKRYLKIAELIVEKNPDNSHEYTFLILKCGLCWDIGEKEFVYEHITELMESGEKDKNASDYVKDMQDLCVLLKNMQEYAKWEKIIRTVERYAKEQNTVYFDLILTEMWMDYYQTLGDSSKYIQLCVEHAELYRKQKEITDRELAAAIDIKIELREKEAERKRAEEKSFIDPLTGIGNRYMLDADAKILLKRAAVMEKKIAVGLLDIDRFKYHNDTYGHIQGDSCLKRVAEILSTVVQNDGKVYRFGGDEFVIFFPDGDGKVVERVAEEIKFTLENSSEENQIALQNANVTISQGYFLFVPLQEEDAKSMLAKADKALYYVKTSGKNAYHIIEE